MQTLTCGSAAELAAQLQGREYRAELTMAEAAAARAAGLVVVTGYSDDGLTLLGALSDEAGVGHGTLVYLTGAGLLTNRCNCDDCPYFAMVRDKASTIKARWDVDGYSWVYETAIPHATFDVMSEGTKYARALVFTLGMVSKTRVAKRLEASTASI